CDHVAVRVDDENARIRCERRIGDILGDEGSELYPGRPLRRSGSFSAGTKSETSQKNDRQSGNGSLQTWNSQEHDGQRFVCKTSDYNRATSLLSFSEVTLHTQPQRTRPAPLTT